MIKKALVIVFVILMTTVIFASDDVSNAVALGVTNTPQPFYVGKIGFGYNGGIDIRFWPTEKMGYEIPFYYTTSSPYVIYTSQASDNFKWAATSGVNLLMPINNNFKIYTYFEPGIVIGSGETFLETTYTTGSTIKNDFYNYLFSAGLTLGLEAEVFLNDIYDKLPPNISIGSKIAISGTANLNEAWNRNYYTNGSVSGSNFTRYYTYIFNIATSGSTIVGFTVRYYF